MAAKKYDLCKELAERCLVAIIRSDRAKDLVQVTEALAAGGVRAMEVTMTTPDALEVIRESRRKLSDDILLGAGSVLDAETARMAMLAGAQFIVTPTTSPATIRMCNRYGVPVMSGGLTPTEILHAWECGSDMVKVFPANDGGPAYIKAVNAPMPQIPLVAVGGVNLDTVGPFLKAGACALGVGGKLIDPKLVAARDFDGLAGRARQFVAAVEQARSSSE
jgi:2-dehydro-3-deoxyphosphogluconate aldolase / (4S)-4-hydroxy-2-oxoglutarate aldolase